MRALRIGVVGVGGMGTFHARALAALDGVEVVVVADPYEPNAHAVASQLGCEPSLDPLATASRRDLDGVVVASPDETHTELALAAMGAGSMVLCEKPLATSLADAEQVVDAEVDLGRRVIQMGFMREYDPAHVQLVEAIADIGTIDAVRLVHRNANRRRRPLDRIIVQSMVHEAHSLRFLTGSEPTSVTVFGAGPEDDSYRHVIARVALDHGGHGILEFDDGGFAYDVSVEVLGRDGDAITSSPMRAVRRRDGSITTRIGDDWFGWFADAYRIQDEAWVTSIRSGVATGPSTWDGYVAQVVVEAAMVSLAEGRTVPIDLPERPGLYALR